MRGVIATGDHDPQARRKGPGAAADGRVDLVEGDLRQRVRLDAGAADEFAPPPQRRAAGRSRSACDFGMKWNILRRFTRTVARSACPARTPASELLATGPDGVFLSKDRAIRRCSMRDRQCS